ncbi:hypothetical protein MN086_02880 [Sulfurovum sp. XGS-02]|uniref:tetratricopeptide repeat protein n=1 Tax=Sulfurovum sp. XGS-02 TaxID=2925411 RepID=UPI00206B7976|nr:hypothetical protein [Sulfurovum sp. XGS-02]UPT78097.1 hypothetical protein MN086_02880 [Sulfurovum sp. XGS-02]
MNQTQKRLSIINHAISITDVETIQLQILKLGLLKTDVKIQEIITAIQAENYAKAQGLINQYIETPTEDILQRTSQQAQAAMAAEEQSIIDEFDLFVISNRNEKPQEIDMNDFILDELPEATKEETETEIGGETKTVDHNAFDALLNIEADHVLNDDIALDLKQSSTDTFFEAQEETSHTDRDTFFDTEESEEGPVVEEPVTQETETFIDKEMPSKEELLKELKPAIKSEEGTSSQPYKAIPYIAQKLNSMKKQYPLKEKTYEKFDSVENLLRKISQEEYTEEEIEETLDYIKKLSEEGKETEAAQLLLVCAASESKFAQFMLARELFKGVLLTKDIPEAFAKMYSLALEDYPEALCDIAQFYEHGIETDQDKKKAEQFYKEAMEFGIKRAEKHYHRLKKENRRFFKR